MRKDRNMLSTFKEMLSAFGGVFEAVPSDQKKPRKQPRNVLPTSHEAGGYVRARGGYLMREYPKPTREVRAAMRKARISELRERDLRPVQS